MRLTCPSCKAEYEATEAEIGQGRRVECSACGAQWFQPAPAAEAAEIAAAGESRMPGMDSAAEELRAFRDESLAQSAAAATPVGSGATPKPATPEQTEAKQDIYASLRATLNEERAAEASGQPAPSEPPRSSPGLRSPDRHATGRRAVDDIPIPPPPAPGEAPVRRRPAAIDAERLKAELRAAEEEQESGRGGAGFAVGFVLALLISIVLAGAYLEQARVVALVPDAAPYLDQYAAIVDDARESVEETGDQASEAVAPLIDQAREAIGQ